jgi:hypothetical protein
VFVLGTLWDGTDSTQFLGMGGPCFCLVEGIGQSLFWVHVSISFLFYIKKSSSQPHGPERHRRYATPMDPSGIAASAMPLAVRGSSPPCPHTARASHIELEDEDAHARLGFPCKFRSTWAPDLRARQGVRESLGPMSSHGEASVCAARRVRRHTVIWTRTPSKEDVPIWSFFGDGDAPHLRGIFPLGTALSRVVPELNTIKLGINPSCPQSSPQPNT